MILQERQRDVGKVLGYLLSNTTHLRFFFWLNWKLQGLLGHLKDRAQFGFELLKSVWGSDIFNSLHKAKR